MVGCDTRASLDGQFQLGIIPGHRNADSLVYDALFGETMLLYCGAQHVLFGHVIRLNPDALESQPIALQRDTGESRVPLGWCCPRSHPLLPEADFKLPISKVHIMETS